MRLLVLEDDHKLGPWTLKGLEEAGHIVDLFTNGKDALIAAMDTSYDLLVLDRMVPGLDGLSVLKSLRHAKVTTPAIFLTALGDVDARVDGLKGGGDDYLVKPFAMTELLARIEVISKRQSPDAQVASELRGGDIVIDLHRRTCFRQGREVALNPKEFLLLEVFLRSNGRVQTKSALLERVWNMRSDPTTSVVETHISRLRAKIEKPFGDQVIKNKRGSGYVFTPR
ncbi:MAG: response regulator transcription factor [Pseudomonadota bacterium]